MVIILSVVECDIKLSTLEYQNGNLSQVKVNEIVRFMCHVTPKVSSHNNVPKLQKKQQVVRLSSVLSCAFHAGAPLATVAR